MPSPIQLVETISSCFAAHTMTVREQARILRNAGLMNKDKRGRGAGTLTTRDATHLVLAVAGTARIKDSCNIVEQQGQFPFNRKDSNSVDFKAYGLGKLSSLPAAHTFSDAVEALVGSAADGEGWLLVGEDLKKVASTGENFGPLSNPCLHVGFVLEEPYGHCRIALKIRDIAPDGEEIWHDVADLVYETSFKFGKMKPAFHASSLSDLSHEHRFTSATIDALGALFRG